MDLDLLNLILYRLKLLGEPFWRVAAGAFAWRDASYEAMRQAVYQIWRNRYEFLPKQIDRAVSFLVTYTNRRIGQTANFLQELFTLRANQLERYIAEDRRSIASLASATSARINQIWATLLPTARLVSALLTDPRRMAEWLVAAMVSRMLHYFWQNAERILLWLLRSSPRAVLQTVVEIEKLIVRVF